MNKKEWKTQYTAARLLKSARFSNGYHNGQEKTSACKLVWDITWKVIQNQFHPLIFDAVFNTGDVTYPITTYKWAIKHNSRAFNRVMPMRSFKESK